jgi:rhamnosyltransferase
MSKVLKTKKNKCISVFIPTYNGQKYIAECLDVLISQELPDGYELEILVTDSGSKDKTLEILSAYEKYINLDIIPNSEFGHGKTRQRAAEKAKGDFILFLTQDATPMSRLWVKSMIEPFFITDKVACVYGRQIPRPDVAPTIKREVSSVFNRFGPEDAIMIHRDKSLVDDSVDGAVNAFFSDVNSAVRKDLITGELPFRDLRYSEDQALARDALDAGYIKAYSSRGAVWHSNEYTAKEYYHRKFDEYNGLQESLGSGSNLRSSKKEVLLGWIKPTLADYKFIFKDRDYSLFSKAYWLTQSPIYNFGSILGKYHSIKYYNDEATRQKLSLESKNKQK